MGEQEMDGLKAARRNWLAALMLRRQERLMPRFASALMRLRSAPRRTRRRWRGALAGAALVLAMTASPLLVPRAHAATITVANGEIDVNDNGLCSLIEALINAKNDAQTHDDCAAGGGADTLDLPAGGTFTFTASYVTDDGDNGLPTIDTTITIDGNGSTLDLGGAAVGIRLAKVGSTGDLMLTDATVSNGYLSSPYSGGTFHVDGGALTVEDATLTNSEAGFFGGAIYAASGATVNLQSGTTISGSYAFRGGGLYADGDSDVTLYEALITDNSVDGIGAGAGLFVDGGTLTIGDSRITDNTGGFYGGGLAVFGADLSISRTTVADNYTTGSGGGLSVAGNAEVTITQSAFTGNGNEYGSGGGIAWGRFTDSGPSPATGTITNTTISGNSGGSGGGIALIAGTLTLNNVTISDNDADYGGGGVAVYSSTTLTLNRTIISGNATDGDGDEVYVYGAGSPTLTANNFNLFGHSGLTNAQAFDGFTPGANDITATSNGSQPTALGSIVSPLADNGGPTTPATQTHALPLGSPARDKAPGAACVAAPVDAVDQRDVTRPQDGNGAVDANECDIGAFEAVLEPVSGICPAPGSELTTIIGKGMGNTKKVVFRTKLVVPNANDLVGLYGQLAGKNFVRPPRFARFYYPNKTYTQIDTMTSPAEHYGGIFWFGGELQPAASVTGRWFLTNGPKQKFPRALVLYATHETMAEYFNTYVLFDDGTQNMVGPGAPFEQEQTLTVPIDPPLAMTDITVQVALVDNDSDSRSIWVRADAGTESALSITTGPSHGNLLNVITLVIEDVPAGVSEVELHLFSGDGEVPGDSAAVIGAAVNYSCEVPH